VICDVDLVSAVIVLEKCARIPHGFALSWDIGTALVSPLTCFTPAPSAAARGAKGERPIYVSSYRYMCVLILLYMCARLAEERRRRAVLKSPTNYLRVRILLYLCPYYYMCVLIHTTICASSYYYICALILPYVCPLTIMCVLILTLLFLVPPRHFIVVHSTRLASLKNFNYYIF
jgi:hypothetical protein